jgi:nucleoside phosphorylase
VTAVGAPLGAVELSGTDRFDIPYPEHLASTFDLVPGVIATGDSVVTPELLAAFPPSWRERLAQSDAVDMESAVWAERAADEGIPIIVCRTIYDAIGFTPPASMSFRGVATRSGATLARLAIEFGLDDRG